MQSLEYKVSSFFRTSSNFLLICCIRKKINIQSQSSWTYIKRDETASSQLDIVTRHTYPEKFIQDNVVALFALLLSTILSLCLIQPQQLTGLCAARAVHSWTSWLNTSCRTRCSSGSGACGGGFDAAGGTVCRGCTDDVIWYCAYTGGLNIAAGNKIHKESFDRHGRITLM